MSDAREKAQTVADRMIRDRQRVNFAERELVPCATLDWPMVDQCQHIDCDGKDCIVMSSEGYEQLWEHAARLEEQLSEAVKDIEYLKSRAKESYREALERAASLCEAVGDQYYDKDHMKWPEMRTDAETGANECAYTIRSIIEGKP